MTTAELRTKLEAMDKDALLGLVKSLGNKRKEAVFHAAQFQTKDAENTTRLTEAVLDAKELRAADAREFLSTLQGLEQAKIQHQTAVTNASAELALAEKELTAENESGSKSATYVTNCKDSLGRISKDSIA